VPNIAQIEQRVYP